MSFQSKQVGELSIFFSLIKVNIFPLVMKMVKFCTTSAIKHRHLNLFRKGWDIIIQSAVVGLSSVLNLTTVPLAKPPLCELNGC